MKLKPLSLFTALIALTISGIMSTTSCTKFDDLATDGSIRYSVDTFFFDTVFTAQGSSTRNFKIYNPNNKRIKIDRIRLAKGEDSPYFMNINGQQGKDLQDIYIEKNDSIYTFIAVNIDPTNENNPFIIGDDVIATVNGKEYSIPVLAYAQNAVYINDSVLTTQTWTKDKPYIIINNAWVAANNTLTIEPGTRVYVHPQSRLYVDGTLNINGTKTDSVIFQGDRIDRMVYYGDYTSGVRGEWGGLYFTSNSTNNKINYALFKNGGSSSYLGEDFIMDATIQVNKYQSAVTPTLTLTNSIITNSYGYGLLSFGSHIVGENNLIIECGKENIAMIEGGIYRFNHCTFANYGSRISSATENHFTMLMLNFFSTGNNTYTAAPLDAIITNSIIYGNSKTKATEVLANKVENYPATATFENCLMKLGDTTLPSWATSINNVINQDPKFVNTSEKDFHLLENSPAIGAGKTNSNNLFNVDLDGILWNIPPSIGVFEYRPE